jgi:hypothetical protein
MRSASLRNSLFVLALVALGVLIGVLAAPLWRLALVALYQDQYGTLTYRCDAAMRAHYLAQAQAAAHPSIETADAQSAAALALIDCQDYDIMQKRLLALGLRENELGLMRLRAIEEDAEGLANVVDAHEIRD